MDAYFDIEVRLKKRVSQFFDTNITRKYQAVSHFDIVKTRAAENFRFSNLSIGVAESTLSDTFALSSPDSFRIGETIKGHILDRDFSFKVAGKRITRGEIIKSYEGRYDDDRLMYTNLNFVYATRTYRYYKNGKNHVVRYSTSRDIAQGLARSLGLNLVYNAIDFIPSSTVFHIDEEDKEEPRPMQGTYQSVLSQIFGWLGSKLPNLTINIFIRGGTLYIIQRGAETGTAVNLDELNVVEKPVENQTQVHTLIGGWGSNMPLGTDDEKEPFSGVINFNGAECVYKNGYLMQESNGKVTTYYEYAKIGDAKGLYLVKRLTLEVGSYTAYSAGGGTVEEYDGTVSKVEYAYTTTAKDVYQSLEKETTGGAYYLSINSSAQYSAAEIQKMNEDETRRQIRSTMDAIERETDWAEADVNITRTVPLGAGWYGQSQYHLEEDDTGAMTEKLVNTNLSQSAPGQAASQYLLDKSNDAIDDKKQMYTDLVTLGMLLLHGYTFFDNTLPIAIINNRLGLDTAAAITKAINDLNLKIQHEVNLSVVNYSHFIDLNDVITYQGRRYFLKSNNVRWDPAGIRQELTIARWDDE